MNDFSGQRRPGSQRLFTRGADGRLRPVNEGSDIGDVWAAQRRAQLHEAIAADSKKAEKRSKRVTITLRMPKLPKLRLPRIAFRGRLPKPGRKQVVLAGIALAVVAAGAGTYTLLGPSDAHDPSKRVTATGVLSSSVPVKPDYPTLLPAGKTIEDLGGWGRVSPLDKEPVFAYADKIGGVQLNVSEQPLPASFASDPGDALLELATQFSATEEVSFEGQSQTAYVGTSIKGPQSLLAIKQGTLILIKSSSKLANDQWAAYLGSLQPN